MTDDDRYDKVEKAKKPKRDTSRFVEDGVGLVIERKGTSKGEEYYERFAAQLERDKAERKEREGKS